MGEGADQQRMAVRRRLGDRLVADHAAGARPVVDHDRLAQRLLQPLGAISRAVVSAPPPGE